MREPHEIKQWLADLEKDRAWLAGEIGVSKRTLDNWFSDKFPDYALKSINMLRKLLEQGAPVFSINDPILPLSLAMELLRRAETAGYENDLGGYVSRILTESLSRPMRDDPPKKPVLRVAEDPAECHAFRLPFLGAVAAGEPVEAPRNETLAVSKQYPDGHFIVEVNGQSAEPDYPDGSRWVIDGRDKYTPKDGAVCVVSDGSGSYLKRWNRKRGVFESVNPNFQDVIPSDDAKLQGYPVERIS